jgi:hypothetical protein
MALVSLVYYRSRLISVSKVTVGWTFRVECLAWVEVKPKLPLCLTHAMKRHSALH